MFIGTYIHTIDNKKRINLPSKLAALLDKNLYVSKGFDNCLEIRQEKEFRAWVALLGNSNNLGSNRRQVARVALGKSAQISVDSANRILIPVNLLDDAKIVKDVVIAGMGDSIELWDKDTYENYIKTAEPKFEAIADQIANGGANE